MLVSLRETALDFLIPCRRPRVCMTQARQISSSCTSATSTHNDAMSTTASRASGWFFCGGWHHDGQGGLRSQDADSGDGWQATTGSPGGRPGRVFAYSSPSQAGSGHTRRATVRRRCRRALGGARSGRCLLGMPGLLEICRRQLAGRAPNRQIPMLARGGCRHRQRGSTIPDASRSQSSRVPNPRRSSRHLRCHGRGLTRIRGRREG